MAGVSRRWGCGRCARVGSARRRFWVVVVLSQERWVEKAEQMLELFGAVVCRVVCVYRDWM